ncbi:chemotaxis protein CheD [Kushneria sinocarnis]|uniref:Probable chemoreceptor glutamine deamidase CheD n=1 Tax=Kushneria sinocarnis TaxID=595502 RepID=A0A420WY40_9GAMM|nr:chemoreceptor glutamine deamidase CheD [Kushneria sinocarnis]RKR06070.1 chemotaxis protein CheD [Kushneria sinocarnis]
MKTMSECVATHRYVDRDTGLAAIKLLPCEYFVTRFEGEGTAQPRGRQQESIGLLSTVLGSCVSACLRDPVAGVAGMNHYMLPWTHQACDPRHGLRYGNHAMAVLIEAMERQGARRERMEAKVTGGGRVMSGSAARVGDANADYVIQSLAEHGISLLARDLGGPSARRVHYLPASGRMLVRKLGAQEGAERVRQQESRLIAELPSRELPREIRALMPDVKECRT